MPKLISVMTPCFNEEANVEKLYHAVRDVFAGLVEYQYEHVFIDNASCDNTEAILRRLAAEDPEHVKVILNTRNFGQVRSPYYGVLQCRGDAVVPVAADFQDPPTLIPQLVAEWEKGFLVVHAVKSGAHESRLMYGIRKLYYKMVSSLSEVKLTQNTTGFGLYDKRVIDVLRTLNDPNPYFRGITAELGFKPAIVEYVQPLRAGGKSSNNFFTLFDVAMVGITSHSKVPLRVATLTGFFAASLSLFVAFMYLVYKLLNWHSFSIGIAPLVIGLFFFSSVQLFFLGIAGEYIGAIYTQVHQRPLVVEKERLNF